MPLNFYDIFSLILLLDFKRFKIKFHLKTEFINNSNYKVCETFPTTKNTLYTTIPKNHTPKQYTHKNKNLEFYNTIKNNKNLKIKIIRMRNFFHKYNYN